MIFCLNNLGWRLAEWCLLLKLMNLYILLEISIRFGKCCMRLSSFVLFFVEKILFEGLCGLLRISNWVCWFSIFFSFC